MVNIGIFYDHMEYFMAIRNNSWPFGIVCGTLLYFSKCLDQEKSGNPELLSHVALTHGTLARHYQH
jgi:hypothetical protein